MRPLTQKDRDLLALRSYREFLKLELAERCARNENYSMRAMARDLDIPVSGLWAVIAGKSHFSKASLYKIAIRLQKPAPVENYFINMAVAEIEAPGDANHPNFLKAKEIRLQHLYFKPEVPHRLLNSWSLLPMALKLLLGIKDEVKTNEALQKRLGIDAETLQQMLEELESIGWIETTPQGPESNVRYMELGHGGNAYEIRAIHRKSLEFAMACLDNRSVEDRNFYTAFFTMSPQDALKVRDQLRKMVLTLSESQDEPTLGHEVYALGTFLVPLTHPLDPKPSAT